jgi:hypothetical protein
VCQVIIQPKNLSHALLPPLPDAYRVLFLTELFLQTIGVAYIFYDGSVDVKMLETFF